MHDVGISSIGQPGQFTQLRWPEWPTAFLVLTHLIDPNWPPALSCSPDADLADLRQCQCSPAGLCKHSQVADRRVAGVACVWQPWCRAAIPIQGNRLHGDGSHLQCPRLLHPCQMNLRHTTVSFETSHTLNAS